MTTTELKISAKKNGPLYLLTMGLCIGLKYSGQTGSVNACLWMLNPTSRWVSILCGIPFEYLPNMGYVNHYHKFLIAPSCAGIKFMAIIFLMLIFSFLYRQRSVQGRALWFCFSAVFSYVSTVFVNGIRIAASIYLPDVLSRLGLVKGWLNPDRLHTLIGTVIYFFALCMIYLMISCLCSREFPQADKEPSGSDDKIHPIPFYRLLTPIFWYLGIVLALPFCARILRGEWEGFGQYAILIICVCFFITACLSLSGIFYRRRIIRHPRPQYPRTPRQ